MVLAVDHLRRHVARRARGVPVILRRSDAGHSQICQPEVTSGIKDEVFGFEIAVDDVVAVEVLERQEDAANEELGDVFGEAVAAPDLEP